MSPSAVSGPVFFHAAVRKLCEPVPQLAVPVTVKCTCTHSPFDASFVPPKGGREDELTSRRTLSERWAAKSGAPLSVVEMLVTFVKHVGSATTA